MNCVHAHILTSPVTSLGILNIYKKIITSDLYSYMLYDADKKSKLRVLKTKDARN